MTPGEFKNGGEGLRINYSYAETPFGAVMLASTSKGICRVSRIFTSEGITILPGVAPDWNVFQLWAHFRTSFSLRSIITGSSWSSISL